MSNSFIYSIADPDTLEVRYIGQTRCGVQRFKGHCKISENTGESHRARWIRKIIKSGKKPIFTILKFTEALDFWEKYFISAFADSGAKLVNSESGGTSGYTFTQDVKDRIAETLRRNHDDPEYKLQHSMVRGGKPIKVFTNFGKFVGEYDYASQACDDLDISRPHMSNVLNGSKVVASGYFAIYSDEYSYERLIDCLRRIKHKPVILYDILKNKFFKGTTANDVINRINGTHGKRNSYSTFNTYGWYRINSRFLIFNYLVYKFPDVNSMKHDAVMNKLRMIRGTL